ncbi:MAG: tRNA (N(6)-L-threonylcarbamoyladenosine(37)-C(2))-methylthiotransferase MtaB [Flavobacteriaceae bacterium]|nr:tRNA (N(6)-L-threonylcarbamoyladenosine(37)-C(2))-methylthiotransferase MtaB [Flavobacteriaceae bacterium]
MENILSHTVKKKIILPKVAFHTLGCKLNFSETSTISRDFDPSSFEKVAFDDYADIYVINTCSVTENADKRLKSLVNKVISQNSKGFVAVIGCYAQLQPEAIAELNGVDLVLGATEKFNLKEYITDFSKNEISEVHSCEISEAKMYEASYSIGDRTRAFLKVQDGCDYKCTYCTIPKARGISRSDSLENILVNAKKIASQGIKEIVLTGVNIGDYGKGEFGNKKHQHTFLDLIKALDQLDSVKRFRISSIEPNLLSNEIISFVSKSKNFVPHFHIPLQSGSDRILKNMKRRYLSSLYNDRINKIKKLLPNSCIGADVIVGFPGETEEDFLKTFNFIRDSEISYLHVFTYSERPNTEAVLIKNYVRPEIRSKRSKILRGLSIKKRRTFYESQLGRILTVLFESENKKGYIYGFTENYVRVRGPWNPTLANTLNKIKLVSIDSLGIVSFKILD